MRLDIVIFLILKGVNNLIQQGEDRASTIHNEYEAGFMTDDERYRLTVENWMKIDNKVKQELANQLQGQDRRDIRVSRTKWCG